MRDHGGNLDAAIAEFGGVRSDWIDLSTGINPSAYPVPKIPYTAWTALPTRSEMEQLVNVARKTYRTDSACLATAGAQAGIQMIPRLLPVGTARVLGPTYNEHAASLNASGWRVETVTSLSDLSGADLAVVVNPNNPDGSRYTPDALVSLSSKVGQLIVDESFADPHPELSVAPVLHSLSNVIVLRSFGKFYGLAGMRLGFVLGSEKLIGDLRDLSGPWPLNGAAIYTGTKALSDEKWQNRTITRLENAANRLDQLCARAGWTAIGGTTLFRLYETLDPANAQNQLARYKIWSRIFPYSKKWIRLGLTHGEANWKRLEDALTG